jgi:gamma-glutamylcyclotransferase (GGCT)/AIG2-like uncharacterized protein YtfP
LELFVYGTLMVPAVMRGVCGYTDVGMPAQLRGYRRRLIRGEVYPGIVSDPAETVEGLVYHGVTSQQIALLDAFESDFYERRVVSVSTRGTDLSAEAYVLHEAHLALLSDRPWSLSQFHAEGIHRFTGEYRGFARVAAGTQDDD